MNNQSLIVTFENIKLLYMDHILTELTKTYNDILDCKTNCYMKDFFMYLSTEQFTRSKNKTVCSCRRSSLILFICLILIRKGKKITKTNMINIYIKEYSSFFSELEYLIGGIIQNHEYPTIANKYNVNDLQKTDNIYIAQIYLRQPDAGYLFSQYHTFLIVIDKNICHILSSWYDGSDDEIPTKVIYSQYPYIEVNDLLKAQSFCDDTNYDKYKEMFGIKWKTLNYVNNVSIIFIPFVETNKRKSKSASNNSSSKSASNNSSSKSTSNNSSSKSRSNKSSSKSRSNKSSNKLTRKKKKVKKN